MTFLLWLEALLLFVAAVFAGLGAAGFNFSLVLGSATVPELVVRGVLGLFSAAFLGGSSLALVAWAGRVERHRPLRQPGPRGLIFITPYTVTQLASQLLAQELETTPFRIRLRPQGDALSLRVFLSLPEGAYVPELAERLQELLTSELSQRTGLKIQEVQVVVHGTSRTG
jgi:hypothetical protein